MAVRLPDSDSDRTTCDYCEAHVTAHFRRTYGTEDRRAKRCPVCDSWPRIEHGSARGEAVDHPDPQEYNARTGGKELRRKCVADGGDGL
ncbi:hypothetical protein M0R89_07395 [Halorussus limi]|uniref:Small CPxCG-related zinc finger protein n=1 Tax=Halorussus limi TaxID=2938695 RepID=A0A8U0HYL3_9EURY|nr:hypothetical protein [Halorussus limi]UPV75873.1 hypothetical protein M0R89_07395 [Halorussus limi]